LSFSLPSGGFFSALPGPQSRLSPDRRKMEGRRSLVHDGGGSETEEGTLSLL
jgi:hypothetical protein